MSVSRSVATRAATNAEISAANIGRSNIVSAATKAKISVAMKANHLTKVTKAKIMLGLTNMPVSRSVASRAATIAKSNKTKAKRVLTDEHKNAISRGSTGKVLTEKHRNAVSTSNFKQGNWLESLAKVVNFKEEYGHCNVPHKWKRDPTSGNWVHTQRRQFFARQLGRRNDMTDERIRKLESVGFEWNPGRGVRGTSNQNKEMQVQGRIQIQHATTSSDEDSDNSSDSESDSESDSSSDDSSSDEDSNSDSDSESDSDSDSSSDDSSLGEENP